MVCVLVLQSKIRLIFRNIVVAVLLPFGNGSVQLRGIILSPKRNRLEHGFLHFLSHDHNETVKIPSPPRSLKRTHHGGHWIGV